MTVEVTDDRSDRVTKGDTLMEGDEHRRQGKEGKRFVLNKVLARHQHSSLS